jgi:hypothetical protein
MGGPEMVGLFIVGATIGAVLCGAYVSEITVKVAAGAIAGGAVLPMAVMIRWRRVLRARVMLRAPRRVEN